MHKEGLNKEVCSWIRDNGLPAYHSHPHFLLFSSLTSPHMLPQRAVLGFHKTLAPLLVLWLHKRQQLMSLWRSGLGAKEAAVWFMSHRQGMEKWLQSQIMLCGSPGRKHPGASWSQCYGWELWLKGAHRYYFNEEQFHSTWEESLKLVLNLSRTNRFNFGI